MKAPLTFLFLTVFLGLERTSSTKAVVELRPDPASMPQISRVERVTRASGRGGRGEGEKKLNLPKETAMLDSARRHSCFQCDFPHRNIV